MNEVAEGKLLVLVSLAEGAKEVEHYLRPDWQVLLDSGAFLNFTRGEELVTLDGYIGYLKERRSAFWRYFSLDRINDHETSARNFGLMLAAGLKPIPVFQRGARVSYMDELKQHSDLVGIGGVARRLANFEDREYLHQVIRAADGHRVHILGCGNEGLLRMYRPYSADSASHAVRFGVMRLWHRNGFQTLTPDRTTAELMLNAKPVRLKRRLFSELCEAYDIEPAALFKREYWGQAAAKVCNLRSYMRFQRMLRRIGVEYFIASTKSDTKNITAAWELENANVHAAT
jgi:hypothetical protein